MQLSKWKTIISAIGVLVVFHIDCPRVYSEDVDALYRREAAQIEKSVKGDKEGIFFIRLFSGSFPIPNRYEIVNGAYTGSKQLQFASPQLFTDRHLHDPKYGHIYLSVGNITIGSYKDYLKEMADYEESQISVPQKESVLIEKRHIYGLDIERRMPDEKHWPELKGLQLIFIHNEKEYLSLTDSNPYLWETLLTAYGQVNGIKK